MEMMLGSLGLHVLLVWAYVMAVTGVQHSSRCHNSNSIPLDIQCDDGYMLQIVKVLHGYNTRNDCTFRPGDCENVQRQRYDCVGTQRCALNETRDAVWIPRCRKKSNFVQVDYNCIKASLVHNICDNTSTPLTDQQGFIASPNYPNNYPPSLKCHLKVQVDQGQTLEFHVIDLDLLDSKFRDCLMMNDHISSHTWCNRFANEKVFQSRSNKASIRFTTNDQQQSKGFWMYYKASPPRRGRNQNTTPFIRTTPAQTTTGGIVRVPTFTTNEVPPTTTTTQTVTDRKTETESETKKSQKKNVSNSSQNKQHGSNETSDTLPIGTIIGAVLGSLVLIMAILVALLVVRRLREKRQKQSDSLHMIFT